MLEKETRVHLVRHGATVWNEEHRIQGGRDIPLSDVGIKQAQELSDKLREIEIDVVCTSTLERAMQTAEIALLDETIPVHTHSGLNERNYGEYEGRLFSDVEKAFGEGATNSRNPLGGETREEFILRVDNTFDELISLHSGKNILLISHGGVIQRLHERLSGVVASVQDIGYEIKNCFVYTFDVPIESGI